MTFRHTPTLLLALAGAAAAQEPAGWSVVPGDGMRCEAGETFGLRWITQLQLRFGAAANDGAKDELGFLVRRALTSLGGHAIRRNLLYKLQLSATDASEASGGPLKQGYLGWRAGGDDGQVELRAGQGQALYGFEATASSTGLFFSDRGTAVRTFSDVYTRGAWVLGDLPKRGLHATLGAVNGDVADGVGSRIREHGEDRENEGTGLTWLATVNATPCGDVLDGRAVEVFREGDLRTGPRGLLGTVGAGYAFGEGHRAADDAAVASRSCLLDTVWSLDGWQVMAEYFRRDDDPQDGDRERAAGGYVVATWVQAASADCPVRWGAGLRGDWIHTDEGTAGSGVGILGGLPGLGATPGRLRELTAVVDAFCRGHAAKVQFEYTLQEVDGDDGSAATNHLLRIAFQLLF